MSRNDHGWNPRMELQVNVAGRQRRAPLTRAADEEDTPVSPPSSCVSSEEEERESKSPEAATMLLAGCPRCLMYVMLPEKDPKCPKCKSTVLVDFHCSRGGGGGAGKSRRS